MKGNLIACKQLINCLLCLTNCIIFLVHRPSAVAFLGHLPRTYNYNIYKIPFCSISSQVKSSFPFHTLSDVRLLRVPSSIEGDNDPDRYLFKFTCT